MWSRQNNQEPNLAGNVPAQGKSGNEVFVATLAMGLIVTLWALVAGPGGPASKWFVGIPLIVPFLAMVLGVLTILAALWVHAVKAKSTVLRLATIAVTLVSLAVAAHDVYKLVRWDGILWIGDYLCRTAELPDKTRPVDVCFCFVDHFEPEYAFRQTSQPSGPQQVELVEQWEAAYRRAIDGHADSDGRPPRHTWFFPIALSSPQVRPVLATWPGLGWGEIEYHLHHPIEFDDTQVRRQIVDDLAQLRQTGAVTSGYGFVHGMYGLAGGNRACRSCYELDSLSETGCCADFTFPSIGSSAQPAQANSVYYAQSTGRPKPYDRGIPAEAGKTSPGLLIVQGPLWARWPWITMDDADLRADNPPAPRRIDRWLAADIHVKGRPNWIFIVVHSHTAPEQNRKAIFGGAMQRTWQALEERFKRPGWRLHYVTTREVCNIIKAAETGKDGNPGDYRDFLIAPPQNAKTPGRPGTGSWGY